jgi:Cys-tRNA(Pro)/Cys-tRNA(Cys) deacylase
MPTNKTLAMRVLEGGGIPYEVVEFPDSIHDAQGVAAYAGLPPEMVYKTLVVLPAETGLASPKTKPFLILVAADRNLDLKKVAHALGVKKLQMAPHDEAERLTGLKVGGISALALLKKGFPVFLDEQACLLEEIVVSAGQRGLNLRMKVEDFVGVVGARWVDASREAGA